MAFPRDSGDPIIAPWWADVDTRPVPSQAEANRVYFATVDSDAVVVTWDTVGFYSINLSKTNRFQLVLRNRSDLNSGDFDVEFRYNQLEWTTGDASGGIDGLGGTIAQSGYDSGDGGVFYSLPGAMTETATNLLTMSNVGTPGLWVFHARDGEFVDKPIIDCPDNVTTSCDDTHPDSTGWPTIVTSCSSSPDIVLEYEDEYNALNDSIIRTWKAIDPICGESENCEQEIFLESVTLDGYIDPLDSSEGGIISTFTNDLADFVNQDNITSYTWSVDGIEIDNTEPGVSFDAFTITIDFSQYQDGEWGLGSDQTSPSGISLAYSATLRVGENCNGTYGSSDAGFPPIPYALNRGMTRLSASDGSASLKQKTICEETFSSNSKWIQFKCQENGYAYISLADNDQTKIAVMRPGELVGSRIEIGCGTGEIGFPSVEGEVYLIIVDTPSAFELEATVVDPPEIECPLDISVECNQIHPDVTGWPKILNACSDPSEVDLVYSDVYNESDDSIIRTWKAIDPICGESETCEQKIFLESVFISGIIDFVSSEQGGLVSTYSNDLLDSVSRDQVTSYQWTIDGEDVSPSTHGIQATATTLTIDFSIFKDGLLGLGESGSSFDFDLSFSANLKVSDTCFGSYGGEDAGFVTQPQVLGRGGVTLSNDNLSPPQDGSEICERNFSEESRWLLLVCQDSGYAKVSIDEGFSDAPIAILARGGQVGERTELACGKGEVYFPVTRDDRYIVVVDASFDFQLEAIVREPPVIECPSDIIEPEPCNDLDPDNTGWPTVVSSCTPLSQDNLFFSDEYDGSTLLRTWTAIDPSCGESSSCIQIIETAAVSISGNIILESSKESGILATYSHDLVDFAEPQYATDFVWLFDNTIIEEEEAGISFDFDNLTIDFSLFRNGAYQSEEGTQLEAQYRMSFSADLLFTETCGGSFGAGRDGFVTAPQTLSRGAVSIETAGEADSNSEALLCERTFSSASNYFLFACDDTGTGTVSIEWEDQQIEAPISVLQRGETIGERIELQCDEGRLSFPAKRGSAYIIVVDWETEYTLKAWISSTSQARLTMIAPQNPGNVHLRLEGDSEKRYVLEYSSDLTVWFPLLEGFTLDEIQEYIDTSFQQSINARFYRVRTIDE
ncbi:nidogen-like domain-containing protein [Pelagicoccus sp. SDUM812003]|nr:nidogen-like domain-containing protein [Pelagicoccus sp. SDUM812003]MDQ8204289.1 nidogen-like domain-containing protein [Pelagicoccus sp. SDUM812003]